MSSQTSQTKFLVDVATETFIDEVMPAMPADKRYTAAMVANALSIARRRLSSDDPAQTLLDVFGADGLDALAAAFRSGDLKGVPEKETRKTLITFLEAELAITNPRFLEQRKA